MRTAQRGHDPLTDRSTPKALAMIVWALVNLTLATPFMVDVTEQYVMSKN